jgi:RND family efflux transporter MFP subunit
MKTISIALMILLVGSGGLFVTRGVERTGNGDSADEFRTVQAARRDLRATVLATGVVRPMVGAEVRVGSRVSGVLERLYVTVGDRVRSGQLLAQLDSAELAARVKQAEAALGNAKAEHAFAMQDFDRSIELAEKEIIPDAELEAAERRRDVTASQVRQAEADLESARILLGYTKIYAPISGVEDIRTDQRCGR